MAKSKKPRRPHRTKYKASDMLDAAKDALFKRSKEEITPLAADEILLTLDASWRHLRQGTATECDINALTTAANMAVVLAEKGVGAQFLELCCNASVELQRVKSHHAKCGRFIATGPGIRVIREMVDVRYAQLTAEGYSAGLEFQAAQIVHDRMVTGAVLTDADLHPTQRIEGVAA